MGNQLLELVFSLSVSGTMVALLLFALKPLTSRVFSRRWQYYIWMIVILRLTVPFAPEKNLTQALFNQAAKGAAVLFQTGSSDGQLPENPEGTALYADSYVNAHTANEDGRNVPEKTPDFGAADDNRTDGAAVTDGIKFAESSQYQTVQTAGRETGKGDRIRSVLLFAWLFGISIFLASAVADYRNFTRYVKANNRKEEDERVLELLDDVMMELGIRNRIEIYENRLILSPLTTGFFKIMLVLPETLPKEELLRNGSLRYILMHELTHVKKRDLWYKWLFQIVLCIHWFNPALYLAREELNRSCELACDEAVLENCGDEERKVYGTTLVAAAESAITYKNNVMSTTLVEEKKYMKERIQMIMKNRKKTKATVFCSAAAMCAILLFGCAAGASVDPGGNRKQTAVPDSYSTALTGLTGDPEATEVVKTSVTGADDPDTKNLTAPIPKTTVPPETKADETKKEKEVTAEENKKKAAKIYGDDTLIAGEDCTSNFSCWSYITHGKGDIDIARLKFTGSTTMLCVYASKETELPIEYEAYQKSGKIKLVAIDPDDNVTVIAENTVDLTTEITLKKGRNRIKLVGKDCEAVALTLKFGSLKTGSYTGLYYSEWEEQAAKLKEEVKNGGKIDVQKLIMLAPELDCEDVSELFGQLLDQKTELTEEQLICLAKYSDEDTLGEYILKRKKEGNGIDVKIISVIIPYLDESVVNEYLIDYMKNGGGLTKEQFDKVLDYADEDIIVEYFKKSIAAGGTFSLDELSALSEYLYPDTLAECVLALMDRSDGSALTVLKRFADDMYADDNYNCMIKLIRSGTKVTAQDIIGFQDQLYSEDLAGCVKEAMDAGTAFTAEDIKKLNDSLYSSDLGEILLKILAEGKKITYNDMLEFRDNLYTSDLENILTRMKDKNLITAEQRSKLLDY